MTQETADILASALHRAFPGFPVDDVPAVAAALRAGTVWFGEGTLHLDRGFELGDEIRTYLAGMGEWQEPLVAGVDTRLRSLRWAPEHNFLYVSRVA